MNKPLLPKLNSPVLGIAAMIAASGWLAWAWAGLWSLFRRLFVNGQVIDVISDGQVLETLFPMRNSWNSIQTWPLTWLLVGAAALTVHWAAALVLLNINDTRRTCAHWFRRLALPVFFLIAAAKIPQIYFSLSHLFTTKYPVGTVVGLISFAIPLILFCLLYSRVSLPTRLDQDDQSSATEATSDV